MGLPTAKADIASMALDLFGQPPVANIDAPGTSTEIIVARHYEAVRREVLREYLWNFAYTLGVATWASYPPFDYTDAYQLPNDYLRLVSIAGLSASAGGQIYGPETDRDMNYKISGKTILYNGGGAGDDGITPQTPSINIRYIRDAQDPSVWDDLFRKIVILKLALNLVYAFTKSTQDVERIDDLLKKELPGAISIAGQENPPKRQEDSRSVRARRDSFSNNNNGYFTIVP
jgi:hypothetical protein